MKATTNFEKALKKLEEFLEEPVQNDRDRAGIVQAFEFTFEVACKTLQSHAHSEGEKVSGPREALQFGVSRGFIDNDDDQLWISMMKARNLSSHLYHEEVARDLEVKISTQYVKALKDLLEKLI